MITGPHAETHNEYRTYPFILTTQPTAMVLPTAAGPQETIVTQQPSTTTNITNRAPAPEPESFTTCQKVAYISLGTINCGAIFSLVSWPVAALCSSAVYYTPPTTAAGAAFGAGLSTYRVDSCPPAIDKLNNRLCPH